MSKIIFHVDMDAFYASVEQHDNPEYRGKPVIIGAMPGHRGVVAACSYEARKFGVHSAQPVSQASRLCPDGIYLPPRMARYQEVSEQIFSLFDEFTPEIMQVSVDEAFLDMTGTGRLFGSPTNAGILIKQKIKNITGLNISIGIAHNHFVAKLASDASKPDGLLWVKKTDLEQFIDTLALKDIWGIGKKMRQHLQDFNLKTPAEIRKLPQDSLIRMFGKGTGTFLYNSVRGIDPGVYRSESKSHSISTETTYAEDSKDVEGIHKTLLDMAHQIMFRLYRSPFKGKTVVLKIRYSSFETTTIQKTLQKNITSAEQIYSIALEMLNLKWKNNQAIRLIGLGLSNLQDKATPEQQQLFQDDFDRKKRVEETVFNIRLKGSEIVKASLMSKQKTDKKKAFPQQEKPYNQE